MFLRFGFEARMGCNQRIADAYMDPWCVVPLATGEEVLFGFAVAHSATSGLSWLRSTPIRQLDTRSVFATTWSGRLYELCRRIQPEDIPLEEDEAWIAYDLLIGPDARDNELVSPISADRECDAEWVSAYKMARQPRVAIPDREPLAVQEFVRRHVGDYLEMRLQRGRN
jgi:hypothetical protein